MISINFNKKFYNLRAIRTAVRAYKNLGDFSIQNNKNTIKVTIKNIDKDVKNIIKDEFCNYVLAEMKNAS